jgi:hypothetical protein
MGTAVARETSTIKNYARPINAVCIKPGAVTWNWQISKIVCRPERQLTRNCFNDVYRSIRTWLALIEKMFTAKKRIRLRNAWHTLFMRCTDQSKQKMKNLLRSALIIMMISVAPTLQANDVVNPLKDPRQTETANAAEIQRLTKRLEEIKAMDVSNMTHKEKRALRKEVRAAEKTMQSSGVYISVGALVIIILLLILLL